MKELFERLTHNHDELAHIIDNVNSIIMKFDVKGRITFVNKFAARFFDYQPEELIDQHLVGTIVPPAETGGRNLAAFLEKVCAHPEDYPSAVNENRKKNGELVWTAWTNRAIYNADGTVKEILSVGNDITALRIRDMTERKEAEEALRKLTVAVEQSPSSVVITDMIGRIEYVNPKFVVLTGYSAQEVIGANPRILKSGHQPPEVYENMWKTLVSGQEWRGEFCNIKKNGEMYWEFASISPIRNDNGLITHYLAVKEDITERKKAEEALGFAYAQLDEIFNTAPDAMTVIGRDYTVQLLNNTMADMLGVDKDEAIGQKCHELLGDELCNTPDCPLVRIVGGEDRIEADVYIRNANNRNIACLFTATPYRPAGELIGIVETFKDITERKKAEAEMRKDFQLGAKIQRQFIPAPICNDKVVIDPIYEPYTYVSGDLLDYVWAGDRLFGYVIDVMGHGLATALQTSALRVLFRQAAEKEASLADRLFSINQASMPYFAEDSFAGCICFEIDFKTMTMSYVSGGINFFLASSGALQGMVTLPGSFLGITEAPSFEQHTIPISYGDTFYFVSDGIFDIMDDTVIAGVGDYCATVEALQAKARSKKRWDDTTALCIQIKAKPPWPLVYEFSNQDEFCRNRPGIRDALQKITGRPTSLLEVALNEAVNNAIRAAGKESDYFKVTLKINTIGRRLVIRVKDTGPGFAGNAALANLQGCGADLFEQAVFQESGRGIMIMKACFDNIIYNRWGNEVLLAKKL